MLNHVSTQFVAAACIADWNYFSLFLFLQVFLVRKTNGKESGKIFAMKVLKKV